MEPGTAAAVAALIQAAGSIGGGMLSGRGQKETKSERTKRKLIDDLLASLKGEGGSFSGLFQNDEAAFQKSIVDPSMAKFRNQIAPGIQQEFVSSGLQRGTGLDDSLSRAGVDLNSMIDGEYMKFLQQGQSNKMSMLQSILGGGAGAPQQLSGSEAAGQSAGGYFSGDSFSDSIDAILKAYTKEPGKEPKPGEPGWETPWNNRPGYDK